MSENQKPETAAQMLESLNEFLLGEGPDFKAMPADEVDAYLRERHLDPGRVFRAARRRLDETRKQT